MNFTLHALSSFPADPAFLGSAGLAAVVLVASLFTMPARSAGLSASMVISAFSGVACAILLVLSVGSGLSAAQDERIQVVRHVEAVTGLVHLIPLDDQLALCTPGAGEEAAEYAGRSEDGEDVVALVRRSEEKGGFCEYTITLNP